MDQFHYDRGYVFFGGACRNEIDHYDSCDRNYDSSFPEVDTSYDRLRQSEMTQSPTITTTTTHYIGVCRRNGSTSVAMWRKGGSDMEPIGNDWVVLFSNVQNAYHVERRSEYERLGKATGNWQVVASATSWSEAIGIVEDRTQRKLDKVRP